MTSPHHLLKHSSFVDFLAGDVAHFEDAKSKGFEGRILDELGIVDIQTRKDCLCQGVTF